jgi:hypothetical protein
MKVLDSRVEADYIKSNDENGQKFIELLYKTNTMFYETRRNENGYFALVESFAVAGSYTEFSYLPYEKMYLIFLSYSDFEKIVNLEKA